MKAVKLSNLGKYRSFLLPGMVILLIGLSVVLVLKPRLSDLSKSRRNLGEQKKELAQLSQKVALLEGYDRNELKARSNWVLEVLPTEKNAPLVLASLRSLTSDHNLGLESLTIEVGEVSTESAEPARKKDEALPSLELNLNLTGGLDDFYEFLRQVESTAPIFRLNQVDLTREGTSIEAKVRLSSYYLAMPKDIGKASRQIVPITSEEEKVYQELGGYKSVAVGIVLPPVTSGKENLFAF